MKAIFRRLSKRVCIFLLILPAAKISAQPSADQSPVPTNSTTEQIAALQLQLTDAWHQVEAIVDQPVLAYRIQPGYRVSVYNQGWFHPGAITPDFNHVDVRTSQQLVYTSPWVSSDLTPTLMFRGSDLEFNAMTKLFYTNRDLPKKRLTEAEMVKINSLYRTIGHCQTEIQQLEPHPAEETAAAATEGETNVAVPPRAIATIERIPKQTRIFYGSIAIGTLLVLTIVLRLLRRTSD